VDLLVGIIPKICSGNPNVDFIIGGDGSKRSALQEMVEREHIQDRVEFLGALPHSEVRNVLCRGHIFLNCSLTESFCIAILEAACCGLIVVSTNVGGVPEVLPDDFIFLSDPDVSALVRGLEMAISNADTMDPWRTHTRIKGMYSWSRVAKETVQVYRHVMKKQPITLLGRLKRCHTNLGGGLAGCVTCLLLVTFELWLLFIEWWQPAACIDAVPDFFFDVVAVQPVDENLGSRKQK
jgi:phosphatidylinositol glycan class A protein